MGDAFVGGALAESLIQTLESEKVVGWASRSDLAELRSAIRQTQVWLRDAEERRLNGYRDRVWLGKVRDVLQEADDLFDGFARLNNNNNNKFLKGVHLFLSSVNPIYGISNITRSLELVGRGGYEGVLSSSAAVNPVAKNTSHSFVAGEEVIGRDGEKEQIFQMMLKSDDTISVHAIVGLVGLGKTTLAKFVFNDDEFKYKFDLTMWVCVSNLVDTKEILLRISESATDESIELVHKRILEKIDGKKFFLVLDDMSTHTLNSWDPLRGLLHRGAHGSKILVTTRSEHVAKAVATVVPYMLRGLSEGKCWSLFERLAFGTGGSKTKPEPELVEIGRAIVKKCGNVPLIIKLVANLLYQKSLSKWLQLRDENLDLMDIISHEKQDDLLNVLRPTYNELPSHLKHCLAYCSLFPKDYEFRKQDLIYLWMAQGFLESHLENYTSEDTGEDYFLELLGRCFFQDVKRDASGDIVSFRMHSMVHYLVKTVSGAGSFMAFPDSTKFDDRTLHSSVRFDGSFPEALFRARKMRTLLLLKEPSSREKLDKSTCHLLTSKLKCLRTLDLHDCGIDILPYDIGELIHLRYLDLSKNESLVILPVSITKLHNLQTLKLNFCQKLKSLPGGIGKLVMLRCLEIDECDRLSYMPLGLGKLCSLQTLNRFVVCMPGFNNDKICGGIRVLNALNNLKGSLKIELSGQWTALVQEAREANLRCKSNLTDLKIEWRLGGPDDSRSYYYYGALLEGLQPPPGLKVLCIEGYRGKDFPTWARMDKLASCLPNLVIISIEGCKECKHLPPFGQLKSLKCLTLRNMEGVQYVENGTYEPPVSSLTTFVFPSLEELTLHSFYNLKGWWKEVGVAQEHGVLPSFPRLLKLKVWNCPKLTSMPLFPFAEEVDFQNVNQIFLELPAPNVAASTSQKVTTVLPSSSSSSSAPNARYGRALSRIQSSKALLNEWLKNLPKLKHLYIKACPSMKIFPTVGYGGIRSIQSLVIDKCDALTSTVEGLKHLTSLKELELSHCKDLDFSDDEHQGKYPWSFLTLLRRLIFRGIPKMKILPVGVLEIKTLQFIWVATCSGLTALPEQIDDISSLEHLRIEACPMLTSLPSKMKCLEKLVELEIMECPKLMERCREPKGEDWDHIAHIPRVLLHKSWRYGLMNDAETTQT